MKNINEFMKIYLLPKVLCLYQFGVPKFKISEKKNIKNVSKH